MKKFLFLMLSLFLLGGANSVKAEKISSDFTEISGVGTNATWDAENHAMSWSSGSYNYLGYFMIKGMSKTGDYYDLSVWETITINFALTGTNNGIRVRMKDYTGVDGDWISLSSEGEHNISITDFKKGGTALDYSKIVGIQLSGGNSVSTASTATFTEISISCSDPTAKARTSLENLITLAGKQNSFGKTESSFNALTSQITTATEVKDNVSATFEQLVSAKANLQEKIDALELLPGYTNLTLDMYKTWEVKDDKIVEKGAGPGTIRLFEALSGGDVPYGHMYGSGDWNNFAELSNYTKLYITGTAGERIRGYFNKSPEGTGTIDQTKVFDENGIAEFDFIASPFADADYIHLIFLKCPEANSGITSLLLYDGKRELRNAVTKASMVNSFAKTDDSFAAVGTAVSAANVVINNRKASNEAITTAKENVLGAIDGLELLDGYTNLTADMFKNWDSPTVPTVSTNYDNPFYNTYVSADQPYGDGNVGYLQFADLSEYNSMVILAPSGTPRVLMNRITDGGNYNSDEATSKMVEMPKSGEWTDRYYSVSGTKFTYDLSKMTDYEDQGFAHLNAVKGANWAKVTVTDMLLYREITVGSAGVATYGSLDKNAKLNGVTAYAAKYADGMLTLTEVADGCVPAGKGVIIEAAANTYVPTFDVDAAEIDSDLKVSNGTVTGDGATIYVLNKVDDKVAFYLLQEGSKLEAGKAYLKLPVAGARSIRMVYNNITDVNEVKAKKEMSKGVYYNLSGQRVNKPAKGLYIVDGKVVSFK